MKNSKVPFVFTILLSTLFLIGCQSDGLLAGEEIMTAGIQLDEFTNPPSQPDKAPCPPVLYFSPGWTMMPAGMYPGWDLVARIDTNMLPVPGPNCYCREYRYCLNMNIMRSVVEEAAVLNLDDPDAVPIFLEAYAHAPEGWEVPELVGDLPPTASLPEFHQQCIPPNFGMLVMVRFNQQFPAGTPLSQIIVNAVGICIVDNVPDEEG